MAGSSESPIVSSRQDRTVLEEPSGNHANRIEETETSLQTPRDQCAHLLPGVREVFSTCQSEKLSTLFNTEW